MVTDSFSLSLQSDHDKVCSLMHFCCCNFSRINNTKYDAFYWKNHSRVSQAICWKQSPKRWIQTVMRKPIMFHIPCMLCSIRSHFSSSDSSATTFLYCQRPDKKFKGHVTWLQIALEGWSYCNKVGRCVSSSCSTSNKNVLQGTL